MKKVLLAKNSIAIIVLSIVTMPALSKKASRCGASIGGIGIGMPFEQAKRTVHLTAKKLLNQNFTDQVIDEYIVKDSYSYVSKQKSIENSVVLKMKDGSGFWISQTQYDEFRSKVANIRVKIRVASLPDLQIIRDGDLAKLKAECSPKRFLIDTNISGTEYTLKIQKIIK